MKTRHLKNLKSLQKWLDKKLPEHELTPALRTLLDAVEGIEEEEKSCHGSIELPPPLELNGESGSIALYSDGGCRGNPGPGAYAYLIQELNGEVIAEGREFEAHTTNNKMELSGPLHGLHQLLEIFKIKAREPLLTKVVVVTDSKYVVEGMKSWVEGWKNRGWKKADNKAPENLELWQALDEVRTKFMHVNWVWIKGHAGHPQNEYCDKMANGLMDEHLAD